MSLLRIVLPHIGQFACLYVGFEGTEAVDMAGNVNAAGVVAGADAVRLQLDAGVVAVGRRSGRSWPAVVARAHTVASSVLRSRDSPPSRFCQHGLAGSVSQPDIAPAWRWSWRLSSCHMLNHSV